MLITFETEAEACEFATARNRRKEKRCREWNWVKQRQDGLYYIEMEWDDGMLSFAPLCHNHILK